MVCYSKSVVYKIVCDTNDKLVYIGSTVDFDKREGRHKNNCINPDRTEYNIKLYRIIRANGGWDNFSMIALEEVTCENKEQLLMIEKKYQIEYKPVMNSKSAHNTEQERLQLKQKYNLDNKDKYIEYHKNRYIEKKDKIRELQKQYEINNADKIRERKSQKITCECGCEISRGNIVSHRKTKKHIDILNNL